MKLLSSDHLDSLTEQKNYLEKLHAFHLEKYKTDLKRTGSEDFASSQLFIEWKKAGFVEIATRVNMEIAFLEDFLS